MRTFVARYPGICAADCVSQILPGDSVVSVEGQIAHADCEPVVPRQVRPERICTICRLAKPCDCD